MGESEAAIGDLEEAVRIGAWGKNLGQSDEFKQIHLVEVLEDSDTGPKQVNNFRRYIYPQACACLSYFSEEVFFHRLLDYHHLLRK